MLSDGNKALLKAIKLIRGTSQAQENQARHNLLTYGSKRYNC